ncbi:hypothetical protein CMU10_17050 [Elizabethkingia anophelis]|nr:hypothetical protein M876_09355 [Elizabethkingia anophelis FMS-007]MDV3799863.1 hypothetical protein [Elizabethkingia anophelis]
MKLLFIDIYTHIIYYTISGYMPDISFSSLYKEGIRAKKGIWAFMNKCFQQMLKTKTRFLNRVKPYIEYV